MREKTHTSVLVVTIRAGEERGMCSAALRESVRVVKDQIGERSVVIIVLKKESTIWRKASVKTLLREKQLKDINIEEMRVVTNDRHVVEQIKRDKGGVRRDEWIKIWRIWKSWQRTKCEERRDESGEVGKLQNCKTDEEMWSQSEE